jgi:hypothetical protein
MHFPWAGTEVNIAKQKQLFDILVIWGDKMYSS